MGLLMEEVFKESFNQDGDLLLSLLGWNRNTTNYKAKRIKWDILTCDKAIVKFFIQFGLMGHKG